MDVQRYCGREKLPGGERRWQRLARAVGFSGRLQVYGFGVGGRAGQSHRRAAKGRDVAEVIWADYGHNVIRLWLDCQCAAVNEDDMADEKGAWTHPGGALQTFAHELGHFVIENHGKKYLPWIEESVAERYGRWLLKRVP